MSVSPDLHKVPMTGSICNALRVRSGRSWSKCNIQVVYIM